MHRIVVWVIAATLAAQPTLAQHGPVNALVDACFTPAQGCTGLITGAIEQARTTIFVQAYYLTSAPILGALAAAKRRGVDVQAILDKSQDRPGRYSGALYLAHNSVPVWIDDLPSIAHNKVVIIDGHTVVTGSFNFTRAADSRNAENVVLIEGVEIAQRFADNWQARRAVSREFDARQP